MESYCNFPARFVYPLPNVGILIDGTSSGEEEGKRDYETLCISVMFTWQHPVREEKGSLKVQAAGA